MLFCCLLMMLIRFHLLFWCFHSWIWTSKCGALRDLVLFVQFKKCEKHPWRSVNFSKVSGFSTGLAGLFLLNISVFEIVFSPIWDYYDQFFTELMKLLILTLLAPTLQKDQTHSSNLLAFADELFWCADHFVELALKGLMYIVKKILAMLERMNDDDKFFENSLDCIWLDTSEKTH